MGVAAANSIHVLVAFCTYSSVLCNSAPYSIQAVSKRAVDSYFDEDYPSAIRDFESALIHYRMFKSIDSTCGVRCKSPNISKELAMDFKGFNELYAFGNLIAQANCVKICKEEHPFTKKNIERPREDYVRDFESRLPYNYLQFAYWKTGHAEKALRAAYTFLQANPNDDQMKENMKYYESSKNDQNSMKDLEGRPYKDLFPKAVKLYEEQKYEKAVTNFEAALSDYLDALDECKALCHAEKDPETFHGLVVSVAFRYKPVFECMSTCEEKLRPLFEGSFVEKLVQRTYTYLQFAYYKQEKYVNAVSAAASALLIDNKDEISLSNMQYYTESYLELKLDKKDFIPRPEAQNYHEELNRQAIILELIAETTDYDDEGEAPDEDESVLGDHLVQEISRQIVMAMSQNLLGETG